MLVFVMRRGTTCRNNSQVLDIEVAFLRRGFSALFRRCCFVLHCALLTSVC